MDKELNDENKDLENVDNLENSENIESEENTKIDIDEDNLNNTDNGIEESIQEKEKTVVQDIVKDKDIAGNAKKTKKKPSKQTIVMIIVIVLCILITACAIGFKIYKASKINENKETEVKQDVLSNNETKKEAADAKYRVNDLNDRYNQNGIKITKCYEKNGNIVENVDEDIGSNTMNFFKIEGLKDTTIQETINGEIKKSVYSLKDSMKVAGGFKIENRIVGNFANVLSIEVLLYEVKGVGTALSYKELKTIGLNYDLTTGNKIPVQNVFVSSAPINAYIAEGVYKSFAFDTEFNMNFSQEESDKAQNMDRRDTSQYEEDILSIINKIKDKKDDIEYTVSPAGITVYNLGDMQKGDSKLKSKIDFLNIKEDIAIFKRYTSNTSIYTNEELGNKNIFVCTAPMSGWNEGENLGKGLYLEIEEKMMVDMFISKNNKSNVDDYVKVKLDEIISAEKKNIKTNEALVIQGYVYSNLNENIKSDIPHYDVNINYNTTQMPLEFYKDKEGLPRVLAERALINISSIEDGWLSNRKLKRDNFICKDNYISLYFDLNGNYLGDNNNVVKKVIKPVVPVTPPKPNTGNQNSGQS